MATRILQLSLIVCTLLASCGTSIANTRGTGGNVPATTALRASVEVNDDPEISDGAVASAVQFVCSGQLLLDTPAGQLAPVIRDLWTVSAADAAITTTVAQLVDLRDQLSTGRGPTRYRQSVIATRIESSSVSETTVSLWWVGVLSRVGGAIPQAQWSTSRIRLVREDGRWKVAEQSTEPGPTPDHSLDAEPLSSVEMEQRLDGFVEWETNR